MRGRTAPLLAVALVALVLLGGGGYLVYDQFLRGDEVAPLSFGSPSPSAGATVPGSAAPSPVASGPSATPGAPTGSGATAADLAGTWTVGEGSVAGYRVREKLANLPAQSDAVGRTESIAGEATLVASGDALQVSAARFEVDLTTLTSDNDRRDRRLRESGIETARFPAATFVLAAPVTVPAEALSGATVEVTLAGELTLHGVTRNVEIPAQARLADGRIEVLGSFTFPFADFGITPPDIAGFVTVEDDGTLEFLVLIERS